MTFFNELEVQCEHSTRKSYLEDLHELGVKVRKPFEKMTKEDLQTFLHSESNPHKNSKGKPFDGNKEGTIALYKQHIKQFYESIVAQHLKQQTPTQQTA